MKDIDMAKVEAVAELRDNTPNRLGHVDAYRKWAKTNKKNGYLEFPMPLDANGNIDVYKANEFINEWGILLSSKYSDAMKKECNATCNNLRKKGILFNEQELLAYELYLVAKTQNAYLTEAYIDTEAISKQFKAEGKHGFTYVAEVRMLMDDLANNIANNFPRAMSKFGVKNNSRKSL